MKFEVQKYFEISTIHGLVYITKRYHVVERIFWIIALIFSIICASDLIVELIVKIKNFPIVTYLSDQSFPVSEINFPAITVCPQENYQLLFSSRPATNEHDSRHTLHNKHTLQILYLERPEVEPEFGDEMKYEVKGYNEFINKIENGSIKLDDLGTKILKRLQVIDLITNRGIFNEFNFSIPTVDFMEVANQFAKSLEAYTTFYWINLEQQYVTEIITQWGLCFTYNIAFSHDLLNINSTSDDFHYVYALRWLYDKEDDYDNEKLRNFPDQLSTSKAGFRAGITPDFDDMQHDITKLQYTVLLHDPYELPSVNSKIIKLNIYYQTTMLVVPQLNSIDESLVEYEPVERNCYVENEKILKFFKVYTKNNCEQECLSDFILSRCGCVEFFMIRNSSTRICSANERSCFSEAKAVFEENKEVCQCFEPCEFVKYNFEINEYGTVDTTSLYYRDHYGFQLQYKSSEVNQQIRKKQFNWLDFLSYVGGILGLFAGFSALSFVELVYWFTMRCFMINFKKGGTKVHPLKTSEVRKSKILEFLQSFLNESSVHGLGQICEFSWISGLTWTFFITTSFAFCFHLILSTQANAPDSRVIAYDDNYKDLKNIQFPAITIVPEFTYPTHVIPKIFFNKAGLSQMADELLDNETTRYDFMVDLTQQGFCTEQYDGYIHEFEFTYLPYLIRALKRDLKVDWFREQIFSLNGKYEPTFAEIRTSRGIGFTFNIIDADEMLKFDQVSPDFNYTTNITANSETLLISTKSHKYPITFNRQDKVMFTAKIQLPIHDRYKTTICIKQSFMVHHPDDLPTFSQRKEFLNFDPGTTIDVTVTPEIIRTDHDLKFLKPEVRGCYFEGERSLKFFKKYSQKNCDIECLRNVTELGCGCVDINQPFKSIDHVCTNISMVNSCFRDLQHQIYIYEYFSTDQNCSCMPLCNSVTYNINYNIANDTEGNETTINVKMNMDDIILYRRYQQFTSSDVVSNVGGLLGLFAGISMLSIVEFFYFFTIRLGVNLWRIFRGFN